MSSRLYGLEKYTILNWKAVVCDGRLRKHWPLQYFRPRPTPPLRWKLTILYIEPLILKWSTLFSDQCIESEEDGQHKNKKNIHWLSLAWFRIIFQTTKSTKWTMENASKLEQKKKKPVYYRVITSVIFFASFSMCVYQIYELILLYLSDPIETQIKMIMHDSMKFPAVTVCNLNPVQRSRLVAVYHGPV